MDKPLISYADESFNRRQTLTLWPDKIHLTGKIFLSAEYEASFPLKAISPSYHIISGRNGAFSGFMWIFVFSIAILGVFYAIPDVDRASFIGCMIATLPFIGIVGCLATFKKVKVVRFLSPHGQPLFSIMKAGKEKELFDQVVSRIVEQIHICSGDAIEDTNS